MPGQFFFPFTLPADQEQVYQVAKQQAERAGRTKMSERRFHAVSYRQDGWQYVASVGRQDEITGKTVLAIFQTEHNPRLFWLFVGDDRDGSYEVGGVAHAESESAATEFDTDRPNEAEVIK